MIRTAFSFKPKNVLSFFIFILMLLDGFSMLALGLAYFVLAGIADPIVSNAASMDAKSFMIYSSILGLFFAFIYLIVCFASPLFYWSTRKHNWLYTMLVLGFIHVVLAGIFSNIASFFGLVCYSSVFVNLLLLVVIIISGANDPV